MSRPPRVLLAKPGLDGHTRGVLVIARALREAGMEVIYTGIRQTPERIAAAALQEDVDAVGLSNLSGAHLPLFRRVAELLDAQGLGDVLLFCGGTIPAEDREALVAAGYEGVFTAGAGTTEIAEWLKARLAARAQGNRA